jgi:hypothetical protein
MVVAKGWLAEYGGDRLLNAIVEAEMSAEVARRLTFLIKPRL